MSSDSECCQETEQENISKNIISEVEKRPALYDNTCQGYNNKYDRKRLWEEVYQSIFKDWNSFTERQRKIEGDKIQKKWKNIKDSFLKELAHQSGKIRYKKKRKYVHYDSLLFLLPSIQQRSLKSSNRVAGTMNASWSANDETILPDRSGSRDSIEHRVDKEEETSEEKHFALMLVAMLRKLNEDQKHYAKVEILNVLHKARNYTAPWAVVQDVRMPEPHAQLSHMYVNVRDPQPTTNSSKVEAVKEEIEVYEMIEDS